MGAGHAGRPLVRDILRRLSGMITADLGAGGRSLVRDISRRLPQMHPAHIACRRAFVRDVRSGATFVVHRVPTSLPLHRGTGPKTTSFWGADVNLPHTAGASLHFRVASAPVEFVKSRNNAPAKIGRRPDRVIQAPAPSIHYRLSTIDYRLLMQALPFALDAALALLLLLVLQLVEPVVVVAPGDQLVVRALFDH